jgi:hypothetical protein
MMKQRLLAGCTALVMVVLVPSAEADRGQPIDDIEAWEGELLSCIENSDFDCMNALIATHLPNPDKAVLDSVEETIGFLDRWIDDDAVFAVFNMLHDEIGGRYIRRVFVIEDTSGSDIFLFVMLTNGLGDWYVTDVKVSTHEEDLALWLGVFLP